MKIVNILLMILLGMTLFMVSCDDSESDSSEQACSSSNLDGECENPDEYCNSGTCVAKELICAPSCVDEQICIDGTCSDTTKEIDCVDNAPTHAESTIVKVTVSYDEANSTWETAADCSWECSIGFKKDMDGIACIEITDPCEDITCINGTCSEGICLCNSGFILNADGFTCDDIDECATNNGGCVEGFELCFNNIGADPTCTDIDECSDNTLNNCNINAKCINREHGFDCNCNDGFVGDGITICEEVCGDGIVTPSEECDDNNDVETDNCLSNCKLAYCGDGFIQTIIEGCDDGNSISGDGCSADCKLEDSPICGDGTVQIGEDCDSHGINTANCDSDCTVPVCGDGLANLEANEQCDGEEICNDDCTTEWTCDLSFYNDGAGECDCGCGLLDSDCIDSTIESCKYFDDDGSCSYNTGENAINPTENWLCLEEFCGNGVIDTNEECDDIGESATCNTNCMSSLCGDNIKNETAGEECDGESFCEINCMLSVCGDNSLNTSIGEGCDDGNTVDGDGCSADCKVETNTPNCGNETVEVGEECDDAGESETCNSDCTFAICGDGVLNTTAGEICDGQGETEDCNVNCTPSICGDGVLNATAGEECDDSNSIDNDGCSSTCLNIIPAEWTCNLDWYGSNDVDGLCDCGCGIIDPNCADATLASCDYCEDLGSCSEGYTCDQNAIKADDNSICIITVCGDATCDYNEDSTNCPADCSSTPICGDEICNGDEDFASCPNDCQAVTTCGNGTLEDGEICDGVNFIDDITCLDLGYTGGTLACDNSCQLDYSSCSGSTAPPEWTCLPLYYGNDDGCDCGCGIVDTDCSNSSSETCDYCDGLGSCSEGRGCDLGFIQVDDNSICQ